MGVSHHAARTAIVLALILAACSGGGDDEAGDARDEPAAASTTTEPVALPADYEGYTSAVYGDDASWLCRPDVPDDACAQDLDATAVETDGSLDVVTHEPSEDPGIDCFYVYPTVSGDPGTNSDMVVGPEETNVVYDQAARLTSTCRVFAPMYRQVTLAMIGGGGPAPPPGVSPFATAYGDVVDAFKSYIANDSDGRGFVLIGHSQGAGLLKQLLEDEIDDEPLLHDRLVAADILGAAVHVPEGEVVGGDLDHIPLCQADDQTGCVVSYATFRATAPPSTGSFFGRSNDIGPAACVNPAADDIKGDLPGGWGLHVMDANIAMGDIESLVASQAAAYTG